MLPIEPSLLATGEKGPGVNFIKVESLEHVCGVKVRHRVQKIGIGLKKVYEINPRGLFLVQFC